MLQIFYDLKIKGINSIKTFNNFIFMSSRINKEIIFKIYQNKIKFFPYEVVINMLFSEKEIIENYKILYKNKFSSTNKNILMFEVKLTFQSVKQAHDNSKKVDSIIFILGSNFLFMFINVLYNIILQITNSSVHLMFPDSLWIINV